MLSSSPSTAGRMQTSSRNAEPPQITPYDDGFKEISVSFH
jgi:hypothetical protein